LLFSISLAFPFLNRIKLQYTMWFMTVSTNLVTVPVKHLFKKVSKFIYQYRSR